MKKQMSDDWCIYINDKPIILAFDNLSYVRMTPAIDDMMASAWTGYPYDEAKEHYVLDTRLWKWYTHYSPHKRCLTTYRYYQ